MTDLALDAGSGPHRSRLSEARLAQPSQITQNDKVLQGAVGQVRSVRWRGRSAVEKRFADPARLAIEVVALRALAEQDLPVPELLLVRADSILMTLMAGDRVDSDSSEQRVERLRASGTLLRGLHSLPVPTTYRRLRRRRHHRPLPRCRRSAATSDCAGASGRLLPWRLDRWKPPGDRFQHHCRARLGGSASGRPAA